MHSCQRHVVPSAVSRKSPGSGRSLERRIIRPCYYVKQQYEAAVSPIVLYVLKVYNNGLGVTCTKVSGKDRKMIGIQPQILRQI
eukprot:scaffold69828_cov45-Prasinocladus_malaysianus.AAC.2